MPYRLTGTSASERLVGRNDLNDFDFIRGLGGDDTIVGLGGRDLLDGGTGNDRFEYLNRLSISMSARASSAATALTPSCSHRKQESRQPNLFSLESIEALEFRGSSTAFNQLTMLGSQYGNGFATDGEL